MAENVPSSKEKDLEIASQNNHHIDHVDNDLQDASIERRVVRKLDWNLVSLVMALCE